MELQCPAPPVPGATAGPAGRAPKRLVFWVHEDVHEDARVLKHHAGCVIAWCLHEFNSFDKQATQVGAFSSSSSSSCSTTTCTCSRMSASCCRSRRMRCHSRSASSVGGSPACSCFEGKLECQSTQSMRPDANSSCRAGCQVPISATLQVLHLAQSAVIAANPKGQGWSTLLPCRADGCLVTARAAISLLTPPPATGW